MQKMIKIGLLVSTIFLSAVTWAGHSIDEPEEEALTTQEKVENTQEKIEDVHGRYQYTLRQAERLKKAEDIEDYLEVVERIKIFD